MEKHLQRSLQWFVCLFHFNDYTSKLGNYNVFLFILGKFYYKVVPNFESITMAEMPQNILGWDLRADQKYLCDMVRAVDSDSCDARLTSIKPGPLKLARWLTTASRILRLYVTQIKSSENIKKYCIIYNKSLCSLLVSHKK